MKKDVETFRNTDEFEKYSREATKKRYEDGLSDMISELKDLSDVSLFAFCLRKSMKAWLKEHHTSDQSSINRKDPAWKLMDNLQESIKCAMNLNEMDMSLSSIMGFNSELCDLFRRYFKDHK